MNLIITFNILSAIVFAYAKNTTTTELFRRIQFERRETMVDYIRQEVIKSVNYIWKKLKKDHFTTTDLVVLSKFEEIHNKIQKAQDITRPCDLAVFIPLWSFSLMDAEVARLNKLYRNFMVFHHENSKGAEKSRDSWLHVADSLRDANTGISSSLKKIRMYLTSKVASENVYKIIQKETKNKVCTIKQSPYQTLYNLYNTIAVTELKAFVMIQFSYVILTVFNKKGNFKNDAHLAMEAYENSTIKQITQLQNLFPKTDRSFYVCDPQQFEDGVSYTRLIKLLQGYIENERNLHDHGLCLKTCGSYSNAKFITCYKDEFCNYQPKCEGRIRNCQYKTAHMIVCNSNDPTRRYDWVDFTGGPIMGKKGYCGYQNTHSVKSWWRLIVRCSYCLCLCEEGLWKSERFFNLRDVTADVEKNMVVTGVRIIKRQRIIHLQIQQGVLTPRGIIDKSTLSWKPVEEYSIKQLNVTNGVDYHIMSYHVRSINLNEVVAPEEHVVTGVRFQKIGSHLDIAIRVTPINFEMGKVSSELRSYWLKSKKMPSKKAEIKLKEPDVPIISGPHYLYSKPNQFIRFQHSSFKKDLAQSTVPYLDSQVVTSLGYLISGVGLIYRSRRGSGGFIAPKLITYDYGSHLHFD